MSDPIRDELHRLNEEFKKLLGNSSNDISLEEASPEQLIRDFGLTKNEAEAWLRNEPSFKSSDVFLQHKKSDKDLTEPYKTLRTRKRTLLNVRHVWPT